MRGSPHIRSLPNRTRRAVRSRLHEATRRHPHPMVLPLQHLWGCRAGARSTVRRVRSPAAPERQQACPARRTSPDSQGASPWARVRGALPAKTRGQPPTHDGQNLAQETMTALAVQSTSKAFRSSQKGLLRKLCAVAYDLRKRRIFAPFCAPLKTYGTQRKTPTQKGQNPRRTTAPGAASTSARLEAGSPRLPARLRLRRVCCQEVAYAVTSAEP